MPDESVSVWPSAAASRPDDVFRGCQRRNVGLGFPIRHADSPADCLHGRETLPVLPGESGKNAVADLGTQTEIRLQYWVRDHNAIESFPRVEEFADSFIARHLVRRL